MTPPCPLCAALTVPVVGTIDGYLCPLTDAADSRCAQCGLQAGTHSLRHPHERIGCAGWVADATKEE